jgi:hypothetical protein
MSTLDIHDGELAARLKRLDATTGEATPGFDYSGLWDRHAAAKARARRRLKIARGTATGLVLAMVVGGAWRFTAPETTTVVLPPESMTAEPVPEQRLVRADTYLALAALEDHIASIDDALSDARLVEPQGPGQSVAVARLERTRAELMDSYTRVRYAEMVSANF